MENHNFEWENSLEYEPFSVISYVELPEGRHSSITALDARWAVLKLVTTRTQVVNHFHGSREITTKELGGFGGFLHVED